MYSFHLLLLKCDMYFMYYLHLVIWHSFLFEEKIKPQSIELQPGPRSTMWMTHTLLHFQLWLPEIHKIFSHDHHHHRGVIFTV